MFTPSSELQSFKHLRAEPTSWKGPQSKLRGISTSLLWPHRVVPSLFWEKLWKHGSRRTRWPRINAGDGRILQFPSSIHFWPESGHSSGKVNSVINFHFIFFFFNEDPAALSLSCFDQICCSEPIPENIELQNAEGGRWPRQPWFDGQVN